MIEYHRDLKEVQSDAQLAALLGHRPGSGHAQAPFDRLEWWQGLTDHCGLDPMLVVARHNDTIAVLPLSGTGPHLKGLANWYSFRLRPILSDDQASTLLLAMARDLARHARRLTLTGIPDEDSSATLLEQAFRNAGWLVDRTASDTNHILIVGGRSYDDYLKARPGKLRTTLKRKSGKVRIEVLNRFDDQVWSDYESIYAESWKPREGSPAFLRAFAQAEGAAGRLRMGTAYFGDEAVAAQVWTVEDGTAFIHKLAHRETARSLSPGSVLSAALFRHVIDCDAVACIDFGTGDDGYKADWMEQIRPRYRLNMMRPADPRNWPSLLRIALSRLAAGAKPG